MILVFGKSGQVARELQKLEGIVSIDRDQADLANPEICIKLINDLMPSAVINAAAYTSVDLAEKEEKLATQINGITPGLMAKACKKQGIPFIFISSDYVFDGSGLEPWKIDDLPKPINAYGRSKLNGEKAVIISGAIYAIIRTSWIISSHGSNFLKTMLKLSSSTNKINVVSDQYGGPTPASNIANACLSMAKVLISKPEKSGIYHLSGYPNVSWYEFANTIFREIGSSKIVNSILTFDYPKPAKRPLNSRLDCSKILDTLNITRPDWREEIRDLLAEMKLNVEMSNKK